MDLDHPGTGTDCRTLVSMLTRIFLPVLLGTCHALAGQRAGPATKASLQRTSTISRRAVLGVTTLLGAIAPAVAEGEASAALYELEPHNTIGEAAVYLPSAKIVAAGSSNSKVELVMPVPGPTSVNDFIDCMWFKDVKTKAVLGAAEFSKSNQFINNKPATFSLRVSKGRTIVPCVHCDTGGTWEGAPLAVS